MGYDLSWRRGDGYYWANIDAMDALRQELRQQGLDDLADQFIWNDPHLVAPKTIRAALAVLSREPTAPPDHEHVDPFELEAKRRGLEVSAPTRHFLATMSWADWSSRWRGVPRVPRGRRRPRRRARELTRRVWRKDWRKSPRYEASGGFGAASWQSRPQSWPPPQRRSPLSPRSSRR